MGVKARIQEEKCTGCGNCEKACPFEAIHPNGDGPKVDNILCIGCMRCFRACPVRAIRAEKVPDR